jgi:hypothetical protein
MSITAIVKIDKQDIYSVEVPGAELSITGKDSDGNAITFSENTVDLGDNAVLTKGSGEEIGWISGNSPTMVVLTDGEYVLHEVAAPEGYEVATDITFVIDNGNVVSVNGESTSEAIIVMVDAAIVTTTTELTTTTTEETTTTTTETKTLNDDIENTTNPSMVGNDELDNTTTTTAEETTTTETESTTTTETTASEITTTTTNATTTTTAKISGGNDSNNGTKSSSSNTSNNSKADSPKTGVAGVGTVMAVLALAGIGAFVARSRKDDDQ